MNNLTVRTYQFNQLYLRPWLNLGSTCCVAATNFSFIIRMPPMPVHFSKQICLYPFYRRKTLWEMIRLSFAIMGIEFTYAALTAFVSPILLELGVNYQQMTMVWAISPVIGFFLSPIMGSLSDRCRLKVGRRRPFMVVLAVINVIGEFH